MMLSNIIGYFIYVTVLPVSIPSAWIELLEMDF
jgi:hypothetical protein